MGEGRLSTAATNGRNSDRQAPHTPTVSADTQENNMSMDFTAVERAGLTQSQFGSIVGVSRITVNSWFRGKNTPGPRTRTKVSRALKIIELAVQAGHLPIDNSNYQKALDKRIQAITRVLNQEA